MNACFMLDCLIHVMMSMIYASIQYFVLHLSCVFESLVNACIMLDCLNDESLSMINVSDQYLVLPQACTFDTQTNAETFM